MNRAELYYNVAFERDNEQDKRRTHFDSMATTVIASSGVIASIMSFTVNHWVSWSILPAIGVLIAFVCGASCSILSLRLRKWQFQPKISDLFDNLSKYEDEALVIWTAKQISHAIQDNENHLNSKAKWLGKAYVFLAIQVIFLAVLVLSIGV